MQHAPGSFGGGAFEVRGKHGGHVGDEALHQAEGGGELGGAACRIRAARERVHHGLDRAEGHFVAHRPEGHSYHELIVAAPVALGEGRIDQVRDVLERERARAAVAPVDGLEGAKVARERLPGVGIALAERARGGLAFIAEPDLLDVHWLGLNPQF